MFGCEWYIVPSSGNDAYYLLYQCSSGKDEELDAPLLLPVKVKGYALSFTLPPGDPRHGEFTGAITLDGLSGKFGGNGEKIFLKRTTSYWGSD
jgi:hypothetical protein